ncbi:MAG: TonB-dependent receptor [Steroidobacteraceae bacterium]
MQNNLRQTGGDSYSMATYDEPAVAGAATYTLNKDRARQYWAEVNWDFGPATLTYVPAYRYNDYDPIESYVGPAGMAVGYNPSLTPSDTFLTHEVRLASNADSGFKWIVGSFYYKSHWENNAYLRWIASGALAFSNDQRRVRSDYGVFGETTFDLSDTWRLTTGLRYDYNSSEHTEVSASNLTTGAGPTDPNFGLPQNLLVYTLGADAGTRTHRNLTYKLRIEKDISDVNMLYATLSSGFLPGDVQVGTDANRNPIAKPYDQETLNGLEVGSKNRFFDETLQLNAAAYYYDYTGYQVDVQPTPWVPGAEHLTVTSAARMYGLDLDATYLLTKNDQLSATVGLIDAKFKDSSAEFKSYVAQEKITGIAPVTLTAAYEHTFPFANGSAIKARVDGRYNSAYDLIVANPAFESAANPSGAFLVSEQLRYSHLDAQVTGNASVNWSSPNNKYSVGGYVRNFTDNVYKTGLAFQYNKSVDGSPSVGRTVGVTVRASF